MRKNKQLWNVILCLSTLGLICCGTILLKYRMQRGEENERYEEIREIAKEGFLWSWLNPLLAQAEETDQKPEEEIQETAEAEMETSDIEVQENDVFTEKKIDFDALWEVNEDVCAWITIPNTKVDYPILQSSSEEDFYLDHDIDKEESRAGSIYIQKINKKDFTDFHTVLYGHDMRDGSMFGDLLLLQEKTVFEKNDKIYVYLPDRTLVYSIFGAYIWDSEHMLEEFDQEDWLQRRAYLAEIAYKCQEEDCFTREIFEKVTTEDSLLTLSTCYHGISESRFLVQAVLTAESRAGNPADAVE